MFAGAHNWRSIASSAFWINELDSIDELAAAIALITLGIIEATALVMACTSHHSISKWGLASLTVLLSKLIFKGVTLSTEVIKNILGNLCLLRRSGTAKLVKIAVEPLVDFGVKSVVMITDLLTRLTFLSGLGLSGCTILVGTADVNSVVASKTAVSGIHIGRENAADNVAQMRNVIDIWQCTCNQNVSFAGLW